MTGYFADTQTGRVVPGQQDTIWFPRDRRVGRMGVVLLPGAGNPRGYMDGVVQNASMRMAAALASNGIPCITCDFYGNSWGNDTMQPAIPAAFAALKTALPYAIHSSKFLGLAGSMGGGALARFAINNPTMLAGMVGLIPAYNYAYEYANVPAIQASFRAAWGMGIADPLPLAADNLTNVTPAVGIPILTGYAPNDTTVLAAGVIAYHNAAGGTPENLINLGNLQHTDAAIAAMPVPTVARFLVANGA